MAFQGLERAQSVGYLIPASVAAAVLLRRAGVEVRLRGAGSRRCFYFPQVRRLHYLSQGTRQEWDRLFRSQAS